MCCELQWLKDSMVISVVPTSVEVWYSGTVLLLLRVWQFGITGTVYVLQLTVWQFGIAGPHYCSLHCSSLVYRDCFTAAYSVAVCYSVTAVRLAAYSVTVWYSGADFLHLKFWQFGIA
jgi:hypothetical protein